MRRSSRSLLGALLVLLSASGASGQTAKTVRVVLPRQADAQLTAQARRTWRWRILLLRARIDAQLYLNRGAMQGRILHDAAGELTRIYHAEHAGPSVKPPEVDPTEPAAS